MISDKKELILKKVEPWNSVRVTFNIPRDAAQKLKLLAEQGDNTLKELGILAVQIEGDKIISLTIAGKNNETTELVFTTNPTNPQAKSSFTNPFDFESSEHVSPGSDNVDTTRKNIAAYLSQQGMDDLFGNQAKAGQPISGREVPLLPQFGKSAGRASESKSPNFMPSHTLPYSYPSGQSPPTVAPRNLLSNQNPATLGLPPHIAAELALHLGQTGSLSNLPKGLLSKTLSANSPLLVNLLQNESQGSHLNNFARLALSALGAQQQSVTQPVKKRRRQRKPKAALSKDTHTENSVHSSSNNVNAGVIMTSVAEQRVPPLPIVPGLNGQVQQPISASSTSAEFKSTTAQSSSSGLLVNTSNVSTSYSSVPAPSLDAGIRHPSMIKETSSMQPAVTGSGPILDHLTGQLNPVTGQFETVNTEEQRNSPRLVKGIDNVGSTVHLEHVEAGLGSAGSSSTTVVDSPKISQSQVVPGITSSATAITVHQVATSSHVIPGTYSNVLAPHTPREALTATSTGMPMMTGSPINYSNSMSAQSIADIIKTVSKNTNQLSPGQLQPRPYLLSQCDAPIFSHSVAHTAVSSSIVSMEASRIASQEPEGVPTIPNGPLGLTTKSDLVPSHSLTLDNVHVMQPGTNSDSSPADSGVSSTMVQSNTPNTQADSRSPTSEISQESFSVGKDPLSDLDENRSTDSENKLSPKINLNSLATQISLPVADVTSTLQLGSNITHGLVPVAKPSLSFALTPPVPATQVGKAWNCEFHPPVSKKLNSVNNHSPETVFHKDNPAILTNGPVKHETEHLQNASDPPNKLPGSNQETDSAKDNFSSESVLQSNALTVGVALDSRQATLPPGVLMDKILSSKQSDYLKETNVSFASKTGISGGSNLDNIDSPWRVQLDSYIEEAYGIAKPSADTQNTVSSSSGQLKLRLKCIQLGNKIEVISRSADSLDVETSDHSELVNGNSVNMFNGTSDHTEECAVLKGKESPVPQVITRKDSGVIEPQKIIGGSSVNDGAFDVPQFPATNRLTASLGMEYFSFLLYILITGVWL